MRCALCDADLGIRPVYKNVRNSNKSPGASHWVKRHVRMKPVQLVFSIRVEGSFGPPVQAPLPAAFGAGEEFRLCTHCIRTCRTPGEILSVMLVAADKYQSKAPPKCAECGREHFGPCVEEDEGW